MSDHPPDLDHWEHIGAMYCETTMTYLGDFEDWEPGDTCPECGEVIEG